MAEPKDVAISWLRLPIPMDCIPHPYHIYTNFFNTLICYEWAWVHPYTVTPVQVRGGDNDNNSDNDNNDDNDGANDFDDDDDHDGGNDNGNDDEDNNDVNDEDDNALTFFRSNLIFPLSRTT